MFDLAQPIHRETELSVACGGNPPSLPVPNREFTSGALLAGEREILIRHGGECYRLRHTRNDKLILTK
ncbi:MAG: hemin uptake protein HemP [Pseudomonadota bacterium]|nr:hemin uptake protein HemP [Pseudomonadota bacterium]